MGGGRIPRGRFASISSSSFFPFYLLSVEIPAEYPKQEENDILCIRLVWGKIVLCVRENCKKMSRARATQTRNSVKKSSAERSQTMTIHEQAPRRTTQ